MKESLAFYTRLADELRRQGIRPMVTLHHWDLPRYLQDKGGWQNRMTALRFAEYATAVADGLVHVDFDTQERTMKDSGKAFAELNAAKARLTASCGEKRIDVAP